jgi:PAT family beta-lactamase induction signal transducer AmpG
MVLRKINWLKIYFSPKVAIMAILGFPYGMMYFLAVPTLQTWLKELCLTNTAIGFFAWVSLPYVLKFLWAPLIDYIKIPWLGKKLGHRRSWLVTAHLFLMLLLVLLGLSSPSENLFITAFLAFSIAFFAGIQDIVVDAYRIEILNKEQSGPGISMLILGYRLGSVTATAGALYLAERFGWHISYMTLSGLVVMGVIAALISPEPAIPLRSSSRFFQDNVLPPLKDFLNRPGWGYVALFIILFRIGDAMINNMANVFYLELGFNKSEIADVTKMFGIFPTIVGGFLGGALVVRANIFRSLMICGIIHGLSHLMFIFQAIKGYDVGFLYYVIATENITGGLTTAVFLVYLSRQCNLLYTATQYALLTSLWSLGSIIAGVSGLIIDLLQGNWVTFFTIPFSLSVPGIFLIFLIRKYPLANAGAHSADP